ncbi:uncharacterized protein LOC120115993 [Hibiscus syriacus]|uniref:uncharacterized protein LOC120115993 n=1 Tax=Hibiscus syriacus TaxID=106335 RepID=UPI0019229CDD|nr:uncharacterized protein LOC120115993 [Hibiscus syriacus]
MTLSMAPISFPPIPQKRRFAAWHIQQLLTLNITTALSDASCATLSMGVRLDAPQAQAHRQRETQMVVELRGRRLREWRHFIRTTTTTTTRDETRRTAAAAHPFHSSKNRKVLWDRRLGLVLLVGWPSSLMRFTLFVGDKTRPLRACFALCLLGTVEHGDVLGLGDDEFIIQLVFLTSFLP